MSAQTVVLSGPNSPSPNESAPCLGGVIRERRVALGLTLRELGARVGCSASFLSLLESGRKGASLEMLERLEKALEMQAGELRAIAHSMAAPAGLRELAETERRQRAAARRLAELLRASGGQPAALDEIYRSGLLGKLIDQVSPGTGHGEHERDARGSGPGGGKPSGDLALSLALPVEVPVINSVAAGYPTEFTDLGYPARVADAYVRQPDIRDPDAFGARVVGDSMEPEYHEGDIVVFSPSKPVTSGMDCFVRIEPDGESTFKRVYFEGSGGPEGQERSDLGGRVDDAGARSGGEAGAGRDASRQTGDGGGDVGGEMIRLQPLNPKYPARVLGREQVAGLYAAVSVTRMIGSGG